MEDTSDGMQCPECGGYGTISSFLMLCLDCCGTGRIADPKKQPVTVPEIQPEEFL